MSEPTNPPDALGYCGLLIPADNYWQGIYIIPQMAAAGSETLEKARSIPGLSDTVHALNDVSETDQSTLGALSASLVMAGRCNAERAVGALVWAIRELTGRDYFTVEGHVEEGGIRTFFVDLEVNSIDAARDKIESLPQVVLMKLKILKEHEQRRDH
jgi:hypothetical protein